MVLEGALQHLALSMWEGKRGTNRAETPARWNLPSMKGKEEARRVPDNHLFGCSACGTGTTQALARWSLPAGWPPSSMSCWGA